MLQDSNLVFFTNITKTKTSCIYATFLYQPDFAFMQHLLKSRKHDLSHKSNHLFT